MEHLTLAFGGNLYAITIDETGTPVVVAKGGPIAVPEEVYDGSSAFKPSFECERCKAPIKTTFVPEQGQLQVCRCQWVVHHRREYSYTSSEKWEAFAHAFNEESRNPIRQDFMHFDPISGAPLGPSAAGLEYLARKIGFTRPISFDAEGQLLKAEGGSSLFTDLEGGTISADIKEAGDSETILHALQLRAGIPPAIIVVGDDPDYLFPPEATNIRPLPFKCPNCHVRVKGGHLDHPYIDRIFGCFCMIVYFRCDTPGARSSSEWTAFRDVYFKSYVKHRAADADGNS